MMRRNICAGAALFTAGILGLVTGPVMADDATAYPLPPGTPAYIRAAIEDPTRTPEQRARDANRKPAELLMMSRIRPGNTVVEFASFGQYFTTFPLGHRGAEGHGVHVRPAVIPRSVPAMRAALLSPSIEFPLPARGLQHSGAAAERGRGVHRPLLPRLLHQQD